jgi:hypothetical protein
MKKSDHLVHLGLDARIILKWVLNIMGSCGLDNVVQDRDKFGAVLYNVMNLWFP